MQAVRGRDERQRVDADALERGQRAASTARTRLPGRRSRCPCCRPAGARRRRPPAAAADRAAPCRCRARRSTRWRRAVSAHAAAKTRLADPYSGQTSFSATSAYSTSRRGQRLAGPAVDAEAGARGDRDDRRRRLRAAEGTDALAQEERLLADAVLFDAEDERRLAHASLGPPALVRECNRPTRSAASSSTSQPATRGGEAHHAALAGEDVARLHERGAAPPRLEERRLAAVPGHRVAGLVAPARAIEDRRIAGQLAGERDEIGQAPGAAAPRWPAMRVANDRQDDQAGRVARDRRQRSHAESASRKIAVSKCPSAACRAKRLS